MMVMTETLEQLSNAYGVSGREEDVAALMKKHMKPYVDEVVEDKLGSVIGIKKGKKSAPKIMLAAHMDEIGLLVKVITKEGFLQFAKIGGIDDRVLLAQKVIVCTSKGKLHGIVGSRPPHIQKEDERKRVLSYDELFVDIGAQSREEAEKMGVKIGDPVCFDVTFSKVNKNVVIGKAFDDRAACAIMIEALKELRNADCTIYAVGTVMEEVGLRGAMTSAFGIDPDFGIAIDVTIAGDTPGVKDNEAPVKMNRGPSITIADAGFIVHPKVLKLLTEAAKENKIPYQLETGLAGSTDAARISLTRSGVPCGVISIPTRYIHSPTSMLSLKDFDDSVKLTVEAVRKFSKS